MWTGVRRRDTVCERGYGDETQCVNGGTEERHTCVNEVHDRDTAIWDTWEVTPVWDRWVDGMFTGSRCPHDTRGTSPHPTPHIENRSHPG